MSEALREAARRRRRAASLRASGLGPRQAGSGDELLGCLGGPLPGLMPLRARWPRILVMTLCSRMTLYESYLRFSFTINTFTLGLVVGF